MMAEGELTLTEKHNVNAELGQQILGALTQRAPVKQLSNGEYRTTCLRTEKHKHGRVSTIRPYSPSLSE